jgi:zinc transporter 1
MNMKAVFLHVLADALGSVIVILSALLNKYKEKLSLSQEFINLIDPILSILSVALILSSALPLGSFILFDFSILNLSYFISDIS